MKKYFVLVLFLFACSFAEAQNLVSNPSFEDTVHCPDNFDKVYLANGWSSFGASSDYFNSCTQTNLTDVPNNYYGYQNASSGNGYCGLIAYVKYIFDWREFIGRQLTLPLTIGVKYFVSFKVSLSDSSTYAVNNIGVLFSTVPHNESSNPILPNNFSQIHSQAIISDKLNWANVAGSFIADSAYSFLIISNFYRDSLCDTLFTGPTHGTNFEESYYYIDDVCVSTDSLTCNGNVSVKNIFNEQSFTCFPNPTNDLLTIPIDGEKNIVVTNLQGQIQKTIKTDSQLISLLDLPVGIYIVAVFNEDNEQLILRQLVSKTEN